MNLSAASIAVISGVCVPVVLAYAVDRFAGAFFRLEKPASKENA